MKKLGAIFAAVLVAVLAGAGRTVAQDAAPADVPVDTAVVEAGGGLNGKSCGDLLIIFDRSNSMNQCSIEGRTKEDIAREAIRIVADTYRYVPMGIMVFPNTLSGGSGCSVGTVVVDIGPDGALDVRAFMDSMVKTSGGTPTGTTLEVASDYANWTDGLEHFVLLMTDGQPTCNESPTCNGIGRPADTCANPTRAFDAITKMANKGIRTFVVGFEGNATCAAGITGFDPNTLNTMAELGGLPQQGAATKYYSATDSTSLLASLKTILGKVEKGGGTVVTERCATPGGNGDGGADQDGGGGNGGYAGGGNGNGGGGGGGGGRGGGGGSSLTPGKAGGCGCHSGSGDLGLPALLLSALSAVVLRRRRSAVAPRRSSSKRKAPLFRPDERGDSPGGSRQ